MAHSNYKRQQIRKQDVIALPRHPNYPEPCINTQATTSQLAIQHEPVGGSACRKRLLMVFHRKGGHRQQVLPALAIKLFLNFAIPWPAIFTLVPSGTPERLPKDARYRRCERHTSLTPISLRDRRKAERKRVDAIDEAYAAFWCRQKTERSTSSNKAMIGYTSHMFHT